MYLSSVSIFQVLLLTPKFLVYVPTIPISGCFSRKFTCFSIRVGREISSASIRAIYLPLHKSNPLLRVFISFKFSSFLMYLIRLSFCANLCKIVFVLSVEPSSITNISRLE